jgi:ATP-dependent helicase HepA
MFELIVGQKVRYLPQPEWGVGHLLKLEENETKALVVFPARDGGPVLVANRQGALKPVALSPGDLVVTSAGKSGSVKAEVEGARGLRRYALVLDDGAEDELPESELRALPPRPDLISTLKEGRVGDATNFLLRRSALQLDDERRCDAMGALLASRVMVKPHQVGVVQRVLSARRPRFVLADEVGLGKTIEAGMIFSALRLSGLARRVLVVAPSHLTVQWLVELFHKFNHLFTLLDTERYEESLEEQPGVSPWARFDLVITSLEQLQRNEQAREEAGATAAYWDLVIIDEAHHLKAEKAHQAAAALAKNCWGLLLLTATPMQLDPAEYHALLSLIDPSTAPKLTEFEERLKRQEELAHAVRGLLEGEAVAAAVKKLRARFPADDALVTLHEPDEVLSHLAETYSLSDRLVRNRRAVVGGFSERRLHRHEVIPSDEEQQARTTAIAALKKDGTLKGAALAGLIRRLESSPAAFLKSVAAVQALSELKLQLPARDAKFLAFAKLLKQIWSKEKSAKILVFTEAHATLESLMARLLEDNIESLAYHGDLPLVERDRQVARFRDPEGPKVLLCTEVGGEGRNFQFAHHLIHYDLPWSPATVEQRIGRLDRIGQTHPVEIHVFDTRGALSSDVLAVLADAVGVFGETVGGLDAVLEEVEPKLTELALEPPEARNAYVQQLQKKVKAARAQVLEAYDPLLDLRSFDREEVAALVKRARARAGMDEDEDDESLEDGLWAIARDLDERLEETVTELALRIGLGVDTDQMVDAFQCAFHFGHALKVEALPGLDISQERTVLGTFWRDTAVEQEEIEYFATGHSIVEALFGFMRDGPYGRNGARFLEVRGPQHARGVELLFHLSPPEPADTSVGAKVPSRQLSRFLDRLLIQVAVLIDEDGDVKPGDAKLLETLNGTTGRPLKGEDLRTAFPSLAEGLDLAIAADSLAAEAELKRRAARARAAIEAERDTTLRRVKLSLAHQGVKGDVLEAQLNAERAHYTALLQALSGVKVTLDAACAFVVNR